MKNSNKSAKKKEKKNNKFKVGDIIELYNGTPYKGIPEVCVVLSATKIQYRLCWLVDTMFFNQGQREKASRSHIDKTAKIYE